MPKVHFWRVGEAHYWATETAFKHDDKPGIPGGPFDSMQQTWDDAHDFCNARVEPVFDSIPPRITEANNRRIAAQLRAVHQIARDLNEKQESKELSPIDVAGELADALHAIAELTKQ